MGAMYQTMSHPASPTATVPREKQVGQHIPIFPLKIQANPVSPETPPPLAGLTKKASKGYKRKMNDKPAIFKNQKNRKKNDYKND